MTIFNIYCDELGEQQFGAMSQAIGSSTEQAIVGSSQIVPLLVSAMARIARTEAGAKSLAEMLDRDHDGSILMKLPDLYANRGIGNGDVLTTQLLAENRPAAEALICKQSGLNPASTNKLFNITTPILLGMIGAKKRADKINTAMLAQMLNNFAELHEREENPAPTATESQSAGLLGGIPGFGEISGLLKTGNFAGVGSMITKLLDKNKDGSVIDDLQGMAKGFIDGAK